jgi:anti-sigma-K factor RskA
MQCDDIKNRIDDYIDGCVPESDLPAMQEHISHCPDCASEVKLKQRLLHQLRNLPMPQPPPYVARRIVKERRQKQRQQQHQKWRWFSAGVGTAIAAGLAVFAVVTLLQPFNPNATPEPTVVATLHQPSDVHILVHSEHAIDNVRFTLVVPENMELQGFAGRRQVAWRGRLQQGENLLSLPLVALKPAIGTLVVKIEHGQTSKEYSVHILANAS